MGSVFDFAKTCMAVALFKLLLLVILSLKFLVLVINKITHLRVIVFADYEDSEKI